MRRFFSSILLAVFLTSILPPTAVGAQDGEPTPTDVLPSGTPTPTFEFIPASTSPAATITGTAAPATSAPGVLKTATLNVVKVDKASAEEDGSVIHVVQKGQALWSIAMAYGATVEDLILYNNLPADPVLQIGQKLIVRPAHTATPTPTASNTPFPPTPTATRTLRPITPGPTLSPTPSITPTSRPLFEGVDALSGINRRSMGIGLIVICALGLGGIVYYTLRRRREEKQADIDPVEALLSEKQDLDR